MNIFYSSSILVCALVMDVSCYKTYSALNSVVFTHIPLPEANINAGYYYGQCTSTNKKLIKQEHIPYINLVGNIAIWGFLDIEETPNCVLIQATAPFGDMVRYNSQKFTICLAKIVYIYLAKRHVYHYYEWFLPVEMRVGIDWDLYFYLSDE